MTNPIRTLSLFSLCSTSLPILTACIYIMPLIRLQKFTLQQQQEQQLYWIHTVQGDHSSNWMVATVKLHTSYYEIQISIHSFIHSLHKCNYRISLYIRYEYKRKKKKKNDQRSIEVEYSTTSSYPRGYSSLNYRR